MIGQLIRVDTDMLTALEIGMRAYDRWGYPVPAQILMVNAITLKEQPLPADLSLVVKVERYVQTKHIWIGYEEDKSEEFEYHTRPASNN
jgi:hypothetical protein